MKSLLTKFAIQSAVTLWVIAIVATSFSVSSDDHWSFKPIQRPSPPHVESQAQNPIDTFIGARLDASNLSFSPPANPSTLLRRLSYVVTGLPPSPTELERFTRDSSQSENAYHDAVERLLASDRYGERWAQHWLDVIRWSETVGFETNLQRSNAWPYRDWVIDALNADMPYDQFIFRQLAGDTQGEDAALGFLVAGPANLPGQIGRDEEAMRQARQDELDEVIRTVSQSLFAITIGCARCHDHKFDPITAQDYYSMQAVFAGLAYGDRRWRGPTNDAWAAKVPVQRERIQQLTRELENHRTRHNLSPPLELVQSESFQPLIASAVRMKINATGNGSAASLYEFETWSGETNVALAANGAVPSASSFALANQTRHFENLTDGEIDRRQAFPWAAAKGGAAWIQIDFKEPIMVDKVVWRHGSSIPADYVIELLQSGNDDWKTISYTLDRLPRTDDQRAPQNIHLEGIELEEVQKITTTLSELRNANATLHRLSSGPQVYAASFSPSPPETWLLKRGDPMQRTRQVPPTAPAFLGSQQVPKTTLEQDRRLALARHLTDARHPLTARVIVNRIWQQHFGIGIVETSSDFGAMGREPSHPELLDWLASELIENKWSLKHLHRLILSSRTFQQSSQSRLEASKLDTDSRLLWRFPPRRLEAEAIRDSILMASGKLNLKMGGPGFDFFNQRGGLSDYVSKETFTHEGWRRMIYAHKVRMQAIDVFGSFDCPDGGQMKPLRTQSITPIQSLGLLNSPFVMRQATFFKDRLEREHPNNLEAQIEIAFTIAFSRNPSQQEKTRLTKLAETHGLQQACRVILNTTEFLYIQ